MYKKKFKKKKKKLYSKEDNEDEEILFMGTINLDDESDKEGEADLQDEIINALEELEKGRRRNKYLKEKLSKCQEEKKSKDKGSSQIIIDLKNQLQEAKNIEEDLVVHLKKRIQEYERLENELCSLEIRWMKKLSNQNLRKTQKPQMIP